jgi:hypothetical protein
MFAKLHQLVEPERVGEPVDRIKHTRHEDAFKDLIVRKA